MLRNVVGPTVCDWSPSSKHIQRPSSSLFEKKESQDVPHHDNVPLDHKVVVSFCEKGDKLGATILQKLKVG